MEAYGDHGEKIPVAPAEAQENTANKRLESSPSEGQRSLLEGKIGRYYVNFLGFKEVSVRSS